MAEALAAIGALAALLQIAATSRKLSRQFHNCIQTMRNAPQEIETLQRQLSNFSESLTMFHHNAHPWLSKMEKSLEKERRAKHILNLIKECEAVNDGAKELKKQFFSKSSKSGETGVLYRIRWYFQKPSVVSLNLMLESAKSSIMLFVTLQMCEDLRKRIIDLENALKQPSNEPPEQPPNELKQLKRQLRHTKRQFEDQVEYVQRVHERLDRHIGNSSTSDSVLSGSIPVIVMAARDMERYFTTTLQEERLRTAARSVVSMKSQGISIGASSQNSQFGVPMTTSSQQTAQPSFNAFSSVPREAKIVELKNVTTVSPLSTTRFEPRKLRRSQNGKDHETSRKSSPISPAEKDDDIHFVAPSPGEGNSVAEAQDGRSQQLSDKKGRLYRALPPFKDEEWKGIRRQTSFD
ncbi:hypothetical protein DM02DRAFT_629437 [Periconia macrospinosa]|uniref:Fungal N-terminal domain-containing protein n=1 Tax=Periconia macrospinosa TaxID=97972 RepID=A0A2V1DQ26_9PLEO|nr:hypothetical protein DM02DRAFT_629437 [Periconia macrospinosa]